MLKQLIIGNGEVGGALRKVLKKADILDLNYQSVSSETYEVLHICFPYKDAKFIKFVKDYQERFKPKLTVIHSTVPIGTSRKCNAIHSPVRGVHPFLAKGIRTFVKYFGGPKAANAAKLFSGLGIKTASFKDQETTEAIKLWDTTQYGWQIILQKEIFQWCKKHGLDFKAIYQAANRDYNSGYVKLGRSEVVRPHLDHKEGSIGGHCVIPNARILDSFISSQILEYNQGLENQERVR